VVPVLVTTTKSFSRTDLLRSRVSCSRHELGLKGMGRYVPRSGWAEQRTSRESCCGKTAIHHTCQPEFRRAKNCSFALRRLGQNREAKRVRRSLPVSRQTGRNLHWLGPTLTRSLGFVVAGQNYHDFSTSVSLFQISDSLRNFTQLVNLVDNRFYLAGRHQLAHHGQILSV